jgi:protein-tyrosine-phosphatase
VSAAARLGINLSGHKSNALAVKDLEHADAVILFDEDAEWRLRQMCPNFTAEVVTLTDLGRGTDSFLDIAAALERLASVVEGSFLPQPGRPPLGGAAAAAA